MLEGHTKSEENSNCIVHCRPDRRILFRFLKHKLIWEFSFHNAEQNNARNLVLTQSFVFLRTEKDHLINKINVHNISDFITMSISVEKLTNVQNTVKWHDKIVYSFI